MAVVIPYTTQTWTDGVSSCSAARATVQEQGINDAHYMPTVRAGRATALAVTTGTWTLIPWTNEAFDTAGNVASTMHDNSTNPARLIARHAGKFLFSVVLNVENSATGYRIVIVQKNSEALPATANTGVYQGGQTAVGAASAGATLMMAATGIADLAVNDYLACVYIQTAGGNLNINVDSYFSMTRVA